VIAERDKVILGIDPGTRILGFGVIRIQGKRTSYVDMGVIDLRKDKDHFVTLKRITQEVAKLIEKYMPDELAIEAPF
jgi:crossover junction endodeoxyribonuclease RuvC